MITKIGNVYVFYRHFFYGLLILGGTLIGSSFMLGSLITYILIGCAGLMMFSSILVTITVLRHPEDFEKELKEWNRLKGSDT